MNVYRSNLPAVRAPDAPSRPIGHGTIQYDDLDFEMLVNMRRQHQTKQASKGVRTKKSKPADGTVRGQVIREFHQALKEAQDDKAIGTGTLRGVRWTAPAPGPASGGRGTLINGIMGDNLPAGNVANAAAAAAATVAKRVHPYLLLSILE